MPSTAHGFPYPTGSSPVNVPGDVQALAESVDTFADPFLNQWTAYSPSWTAASVNPVIGDGTIVGRYRQVGKTVDFQIVITMGSTTTYGTGAYSVSIPVTAADTRAVHIGTLRTSVTFPVFAEMTSTTSALLRVLPTTAGNQFTSMAQGTPVTLASGHVITIAGTYEAA